MPVTMSPSAGTRRYAVTGKWIATHGNLEVHTGLEWTSKSADVTVVYEGSYGHGSNTTLFQFDHLTPVLLAEANNLGGDRLMFRVPALSEPLRCAPFSRRMPRRAPTLAGRCRRNRACRLASTTQRHQRHVLGVGRPAAPVGRNVLFAHGLHGPGREWRSWPEPPWRALR